jgi:hypothetical protein
MNKKVLSFIVGSLMMVHSAYAQVEANVDHTNLALGQSLTLTIVLPDSGDKPDLNPLNANFEIYGTSSSSQMSIVNGKTSSQSSYQVTLMPKNPGKQLIPALKVGNDMTAVIAIEVTQGGAASGKQAAGSQRELFADVSSFKQATYVGVPVVVSLKIYIAVSVANLSLEQFNIPNAKIQQQGKSIQYQDTQGNTNYQVVEQKYLVTPTAAGEITIPALKIHGVRAGQDQRGGGFFAMMDQQPFVISSKPLTLKVKSTPAGVNPMSWLPANSLNVSESWSQNSRQVKVGEAITRTITINTDGVMASSLPELEFSKPQGVNAYPDKANSSDVIVGGKLRAQKTFKIAYVPTQAGKIEFPATKIEWWDLKSDSMQHALIPATSFEVISDGKTTASAVTANTIAGNKVVASQNATDIKKNNAPKSIWFYIALAIGALWLISVLALVVWWRSRKKSKPSNKSAVMGEAKPAKPVSIETITSEKEALNAFVAACKTHDIQAMNKALLRFASLHYNRPIYTVSDIKDLNNSNAKLADLIEQFNLALYRDAQFSHFGEFAAEVSALILKKKTLKAKDKSLDEFYPR